MRAIPTRMIRAKTQIRTYDDSSELKVNPSILGGSMATIPLGPLDVDRSVHVVQKDPHDLSEPEGDHCQVVAV